MHHHRPCTVEALQWVADLIGRYLVAPTRAITARERYNPLFVNGRVAMIESLPADLGVFRAAAGLRFDVAPLPVSPTGKKAATRRERAGHGVVEQEQGRAWEFLSSCWAPRPSWSTPGGGRRSPPASRSSCTPRWPSPTRCPRSFKMFVEGSSTSALDPQLTNWRDVEAPIGKELTPLWDGQRSAPRGRHPGQGRGRPAAQGSPGAQARD